MLWHWSLTSSIFSLISVPERILRELPRDARACNAERGDKGELRALLPLVLGDMMFWLWQTPIMLTSYGWVLFLVGYFVLILAPLFASEDVILGSLVRISRVINIDFRISITGLLTSPGWLTLFILQTAGITAGVCFLVFLHFVMLALVTMRRLEKVKKIMAERGSTG